MKKISKWWEDRANENFWLEVTRREDIGANLKSPQRDESGEEFWSYSLIKKIKDGDVVYHYDGISQAIIARSLASGLVWADDIIWAARGLSARSANIVPHSRPGWYLALERFDRLSRAITLNAVRENTAAIVSLKDSLTREVGGPLYFPFEVGSKRPIRPMQGYLFKLPSAFLGIFGIEALPPLLTAIRLPSVAELGDEYRTADELAAIAERDPFAVDPALVERGVHGHAITQNALARHLQTLGIEPRSPRAGEPNFDIAWRAGHRVFVAEVKSLTLGNEEKQLRLGLGQVLRYAHLFDLDVTPVPVLVLERCPSDGSWAQLCESHGVVLVWPETFSSTFKS